MDSIPRRKDTPTLAAKFKGPNRMWQVNGGTDESPAVAPPHSWCWVPIRSLAPRHRERIGEHLLQLSNEDRYLRFGYRASDLQVGRYVDVLDFDRDEIFGIFNRRLMLVAMAHLAYAPVREGRGGGSGAAEFGVSVLPRARGRGYGARLFEHAVLHARNRSVDALTIHALSKNEAMLKIARRAGAVVQNHASESEASLKLPPDSMVSHWEEAVSTHAAELNYRVKAHAKNLQSWWEALLGGDLWPSRSKTEDD